MSATVAQWLLLGLVVFWALVTHWRSGDDVDRIVGAINCSVFLAAALVVAGLND